MAVVIEREVLGHPTVEDPGCKDSANEHIVLAPEEVFQSGSINGCPRRWQANFIQCDAEYDAKGNPEMIVVLGRSVWSCSKYANNTAAMYVAEVAWAR